MILHYNIIETLSDMRSVFDRNVVMRRMTVLCFTVLCVHRMCLIWMHKC